MINWKMAFSAAIGFLVPAFLFTIFFTLEKDNYGSLADWVSGLGSIGAIFAVMWQVNKQKKVERALETEKKRPRFLITYVEKTSNECLKFYNSSIREYIQNGEIQIPSSCLYVVLKNVSINPVYGFDIVLNYYENKELKTECWSVGLISPNEEVSFIPSFWFGDRLKNVVYCEIIIKFVSTSNEIGFLKMNKFKNISIAEKPVFDKEKYFFVKDKRRSEVEAFNEDKMITKNSKLFERFDKLLSDNLDNTLCTKNSNSTE